MKTLLEISKDVVVKNLSCVESFIDFPSQVGRELWKAFLNRKDSPHLNNVKSRTGQVNIELQVHML